MKFGYVVRPKADQDLDDIADYLADEAGLDTGLGFLADFHATCLLLVSQPEMGWPCRIQHAQLASARTFRVSERFNRYMIFYRCLEHQIEILRVLHGVRDLQAIFAREGTEQ